MKKILVSMVTTVAVLLGFIYVGNIQNIRADDLNGLGISRNAKNPVVTTQTSVIYKVHVGKNMAENKLVSQSTLQKGTKLFSTRYLMSTGGYVVYSGEDGKYTPSDHYFYLVATNSPTAWYKKINFHSGSSSYAHGYWHDSHYTSLIRGTHYWFRISGWNGLGKDRFRFPYHGYDRIHYIQEGNHDLIFAYNSQTGFYDYITFKNPGNSNYLLVGSPDSNSYSKLIRGNR
ncbi:MAG: hypothetical protein LKF37_10035 [Lentilactobacillus diolivorans]|nr:hypothetical protein [Lentilactobacillus diolivorans]